MLAGICCDSLQEVMWLFMFVPSSFRTFCWWIFSQLTRLNSIPALPKTLFWRTSIVFWPLSLTSRSCFHYLLQICSNTLVYLDDLMLPPLTFYQQTQSGTCTLMLMPALCDVPQCLSVYMQYVH